MKWPEQTILAFDTETTGPDPTTARIVTADVVQIDGPTETVDAHGYLADPGVEIPAEATAVHGVTTAHARECGQNVADVVLRLANDLEQEWKAGRPVVAFNASYDLTVLDRELRRHHGRELKVTGPVLDPFVLDKMVDRYRKGKRQLGAVCAHYAISLENAHTSAADAEAAGWLMLRLAEKYPAEIGDRSLRELWTVQVRAYREQAAGLEQYKRDLMRKDGATEDEIAAMVIPREWPLRPFVEEVSA